ncbi:hypothetical protein ACFONC_15335 [Luteimonas soli]|uniref:Uncharacterized protein n=1 Tax=Luteimonas soli TaxID=1648966 RepID=A0ABV7XRK5_9GAMM
MDIPSISAALSSLKTATDIAKMVRESTTTLEKAEINLKMADLIGTLADTRVQLAEIKEALLERDEKITSLETALNTRANLSYEAPYYWEMKGEERVGPYCQKCYDVDGKLVRLQGSTSTRGWWHCHSCDRVVHDKNYDNRPIRFQSEW